MKKIKNNKITYKKPLNNRFIMYNFSIQNISYFSTNLYFISALARDTNLLSNHADMRVFDDRS